MVKPHVVNNSGYNEWYTPEVYIVAARNVMGNIDLDPASSDEANKIVKATTFYTIEQDGLEQQWCGRVWMNPPYGRDLIDKFCYKLLDHLEADEVQEAIVLVNNATDTAWFQAMAEVAQTIIFTNRRIKFQKLGKETGSPLQGQAILYFGDNPKKFKSEFRRFGFACDSNV